MFKARHTFYSVAKLLSDGLSDGTIVLENPDAELTYSALSHQSRPVPEMFSQQEDSREFHRRILQEDLREFYRQILSASIRALSFILLIVALIIFRFILKKVPFSKGYETVFEAVHFYMVLLLLGVFVSTFIWETLIKRSFEPFISKRHRSDERKKTSIAAPKQPRRSANR
jgi:hypothetical protein